VDFLLYLLHLPHHQAVFFHLFVPLPSPLQYCHPCFLSLPCKCNSMYFYKILMFHIRHKAHAVHNLQKNYNLFFFTEKNEVNLTV
jgi:hypothetical protein